MLEAHPNDHICLHIGDSQSERDRMLDLRNSCNISERELLCSTWSGTSTALGKRLHAALISHHMDENNQNIPPGEKQGLNQIKMHLELLHALNNKWPRHYLDTKPTPTLYSIKVDSHQLEDDGTTSGRYESLIPCRHIVHANTIPDKICTWLLREDLLRSRIHTTPTDIKHTGGLTIFLTIGGNEIDNDTAKTIDLNLK